MADSASQQIMQLPLDSTPSYQESIPLAIIPSRPSAVDYDPTADLVYWSDTGDTSISRTSARGANQRRIISNVNSEGLAVDFVGKNIYWSSTSNTGGKIQVATLEGRHVKLLHRANRPRAVVIDFLR